MREENKQFLEANRHHWITLRDAEYLRGLNGSEREGMERVMREEFIPNYTADLWCGTCVMTMVRQLYTRYDQWLEDENKKQAIKVAANFPSHKRRK